MLSVISRFSGSPVRARGHTDECLSLFWRAFGTNVFRTHSEAQKGNRLPVRHFKKSHYRTEEVERLREAVKKVGDNVEVGKWDKVAALVGTRNAESCRKKWDNLTLQTVVGEWDEAESKLLAKLYRKYERKPYGKWMAIASELGNGRTSVQCRGRWYTMNEETKRYKGDWTADEDELLKSRVMEFGQSDWINVARGIPFRTPRQARQRWVDGLGGRRTRKGPATKVKYGRWSPEEDKLLLALIEKHKNRWSKIAKGLPARTMRQVRARWTRTLNPDIKVAKWTPREDEKLKELVPQFRNKWKHISTHLEGRTPYDCRDRWEYVLDPRWRKGSYTVEEDRKLLAILPKTHRAAFSWAKASAYVGTRSRKQCSERYRYLLKMGKAKLIPRPPGAMTRNSPRIYSAKIAETKSSDAAKRTKRISR